MGPNRRQHRDSRLFGTVPTEDAIGGTEHATFALFAGSAALMYNLYMSALASCVCAVEECESQSIGPDSLRQDATRCAMRTLGGSSLSMSPAPIFVFGTPEEQR